jgi:hypothetical protein
MITTFLALDALQSLGADIGYLTARSLSTDISAKNRPDNMAVVYDQKYVNLKRMEKEENVGTPAWRIKSGSFAWLV